MNTRHRAREAAFQILYEFETQSEKTPTCVDDILDSHFSHFDIPRKSQEFAKTLVKGTLEKKTELDQLLEDQSQNWRVNRMAWVDRNLLRMSLYELLFLGDIPSSVTIDEAIEIGKKFGGAETSPFVNGVLDAIAKQKGVVLSQNPDPQPLS